MTHEDVNIVGDDCADTGEDGHANTMGDDFENPNVNPLASDPELQQEDNVPMSNLVSRVVNSTIPPSSKSSLVAGMKSFKKLDFQSSITAPPLLIDLGLL
ncbi:hypothetical protein LWI28_028092 [Acer negundo]|uniref:Uncharacterized protein n=1 Tax=Acer negundo TaxID=4023 RepID=A0AAD5JHC7_ACENE|nr:hypothetical protein LWI28_028092 [Acer negundo]